MDNDTVTQLEEKLLFTHTPIAASIIAALAPPCTQLRIVHKHHHKIIIIVVILFLFDMTFIWAKRFQFEFQV